MSLTEDRVTSIPVRASTVRLLQQLKTGAQNWDEFLLSAIEDMLPPDTEAELERRELTEKPRSFRAFDGSLRGRRPGRSRGRAR